MIEGEPTPDESSVPRALIAVCQDNLYLSEEDARYTTEDLLIKIRRDLKEPDIASVVQDALEEANSEEDKYLIAETVFSIVEAVKTFHSSKYKQTETE
jgi:hypothetical protein